MPLSQLEVIVRVAGATLMLTAAFGAPARLGTAARYFAPLALCLCGFLAGNTIDPSLRLAGPLAGPAAGNPGMSSETRSRHRRTKGDALPCRIPSTTPQ